MRSFKDPFEIKTDVRFPIIQGGPGTRIYATPKSSMLKEELLRVPSQLSLGRYGSKQSIQQSQFETGPSSADLKTAARKSVNLATLNSTLKNEEEKKKMRKMEVLAQTDKETIEVQQKKMHVLRAELEHI